jgi:hypothetical protein
MAHHRLIDYQLRCAHAFWGAGMRLVYFPIVATALSLLVGCVSPEEQRAADQRQCTGYGFAPGNDAFANCMMNINQQRDAQAAADRRASADRDAADRRARQAKDQADQDAWDKKTGQGKYANSSLSPPASPPAFVIPDLSGMNCTTTSSSSGTPNNLSTTSNTSCHN